VSNKALVDAHGQPCYPIELAPDVYRNPGPYKDIISYWDGHAVYLRPIGQQLARWNDFRQSQLKNRRYYLQENRFPEFQQMILERRRRFGLSGDVRLLEDRDEQSSLDHWMEYQDYELRRCDCYEKDLEKAQSALFSRRKACAEAGISAFERTQELGFGGYFGLSMEFGGEEGPAWKKRILAERKVKLAESRLKAADSDDLGEIVERDTWIRRFEEHVEAAQVRLDAVPEYRQEDWSLGGKFYVQEGKNERERHEKTDDACRRRFDDERNAKDGLRLAKDGLQAARSDGFGKVVERAALVKIAQEEVESARVQFEEEKKSVAKIALKRKVLGALGWITSARLQIDKHRVLLVWIERRRCEMASSCASTGEDDDHGQSKRSSSRTSRDYRATERSGPNRFLHANGHKRKRSTKSSIVSPSDPSKVTKPPNKRRSLRQQMKIAGNASQQADKPATHLSTPESTGNKASKAKDVRSTSLHSIRSSRISKPSRKRPPGQRGNGVKLPKNGNSLAPSSTPSPGRKTAQQPANAPLRRGARIRKQPDRFRPG